ncbi:hypothetical protein EV652_10370 [Kribbella steppae]|uniref:Uncharacterized protein n=1 Tax=Kribbella steppae TaxID=2512223 RepID=A0A4R2HPB4_9ACTN|nr:hypothetical protein [Kribbella steppae]TCO33071.1 hypothetical protein EV652_10370 [Kribbella steppae]
MDGSEIWAHINDSVAAAGWPLVVLTCALVFMILFRGQIGERISNIVKAKAGIVSVELDANQQANEVLGETVPEVLGRPEPKAITAGPDKPADVDGESSTVTGSAHLEGRATITASADVARASGTASDADVALAAEADDLFARREQIEDIIRASWRAGYEAAQGNESAVPPEPNIVWTGSKPAISGWNVVVRPASIRSAAAVGTPTVVQGPNEKVRRLEDEIRRLRASGVQTSKSATPDYLLYIELQDKLRRLDPNSPFA